MASKLSLFLPLAAALGVAAVGAGCIKSKCYADRDCPSESYCDEASGECLGKQCLTNEACAEGYYCDDYQCLQGCKQVGDCEEGFKCIERRCVPYKEECDCPAAPEFCSVDFNPGSPTAEKEVCVSDYQNGGLAIFFGSVKCGHCQATYDMLLPLKEELAAQGLEVTLLFASLKGVGLSLETVKSAFPDSQEPIVQDTDDGAFWEAYMADWYHLVFVGKSGCVAAHFTDVESALLTEETLALIREAWIQSTTVEWCPAAPEPGPESPNPEPLPETVAADLDVERGLDLVEPWETIAPDGEVEPDGPAAETDAAAKPDSELPDGLLDESSPADETASQELPPLVLQDVCQVLPHDPIEVGELVPYFLCKDVNTASASFGAGFSPWSMKELVWIAYCGSCT
jgi:hypothetical protein